MNERRSRGSEVVCQPHQTEREAGPEQGKNIDTLKRNHAVNAERRTRFVALYLLEGAKLGRRLRELVLLRGNLLLESGAFLLHHVPFSMFDVHTYIEVGDTRGSTPKHQ